MDLSLFDAFDEGVPPSKPAASPEPRAPSIAGANTSAPRGAFAHLVDECICSVTYHGINNEVREELEQALKGSVIAQKRPREGVPGQHSAVLCAEQPGVVHYFQAFAADYAGADGAAAAAAAPRPHYECPQLDPLPGSRQRRGKGRGGGRGFGGRGGPYTPAAASYSSGRYFDDVATTKPGELSAELRALLGMREDDPPPYLMRMQQLGYPPGYLGHPDTGGEQALRLLSDEEGSTGLGGASGASDALPSRGTSVVPLVDFPGLNVPPPPGANLALWNWRGPITR